MPITHSHMRVSLLYARPESEQLRGIYPLANRIPPTPHVLADRLFTRCLRESPGFYLLHNISRPFLPIKPLSRPPAESVHEVLNTFIDGVSSMFILLLSFLNNRKLFCIFPYQICYGKALILSHTLQSTTRRKLAVNSYWFPPVPTQLPGPDSGKAFNGKIVRFHQRGAH